MEFFAAPLHPPAFGVRSYQPYCHSSLKAFHPQRRQIIRANPRSMSQPGHTPQAGDAAYIAQGFHAPSFGDDDFDLNTFAMTTEADQEKAMIAQQQQLQMQQQQQQMQQQQQQMHNQQQQQQQATRTHIYISAPVGHGQQSLGGRGLHIISNPGAVTQHNMNVSGCQPGLATSDSLAPKFPPQNFDVPDIILSNSVTASEAGMPVGMTSGVTSSMAAMTSARMTSSMYPGGEAVSCVQSGMTQQPVNRVYYTNVISATGVPQMHGRILSPGQQTQGVPPGMYSLLQRQQHLQLQQQQQQQLHQQPHLQQQQQMTTLGFQTAVQSSMSPAGSSHSSSPGRESSEDSDDCLPLAQLVTMKRAATDVSMATDTIPMTTAVTGDAQTPPVGVPRAGEGGAGGSLSPAKKQKAPKKKKKKDPNEPQKPVSAYALFFRDTQAAIKGQNPSASFGEVSKIVASMWDGLDPAHKEVYKKKTELAKKEYLKQLAAYRASQVSQSAVEEANTSSEKSPSPPSVQPMSISATSVPSATTITHSYVDMQAMQQQQMQQQQQQMQQQQLQQQQMQQQQLQHHQYTAPQTQMEVTPTFHTLTPTTSTTDPIMPALDNGLFPQSAMQESPSNISMMCVRDGCGNLAIENPGWDAEYCSNECVVTHCRDIFTAWVASRGGSSSYPVK